MVEKVPVKRWLGPTSMASSVTAAQTAATRLLRRWFEDEQTLHAVLQAQSPAAQREALGRAATYFGVARSLRRLPEQQLDILRFELLRRCFADSTRTEVSEQRVADLTIAVAQRVASQYGGKLYLSLATKLLWLKYRDPFVIYDSVVR